MGRGASIAFGLTVLIALVGFVVVRPPTRAEGFVVPAPAIDVPAGNATTAVAVIAGGCFWGVQAVFQHVDGVLGAVSGYAGGEARTAEYEIVGTGMTGHAESVQITYDPRQISYGEILQIFFSVAHDPTQLDRQGPDVGSQYRTAIFPINAEQERVARAYVTQLEGARVFDAAIVTKIEPGKTFYPAESYHQDYLVLNPKQPYIIINDLPKIDDLRTSFPDRYRSTPILVGAGARE